MTWQGNGGAGGPGGNAGDGRAEPDDATRVDWPAAAIPPGAPGNAAPEPPAAPAPPPAYPEGGTVPPPAVPPAPGVPAGPAPAPVVQPWEAPSPAGSWGVPPTTTGRRYAVPGAPGLVYAGAIPRAAAYIVDSVILSIIAGIAAAPFAADVAMNAFDPNNPMGDLTAFTARSGVASLIAVVIEAVYFVFLWSSGGRATLGMRLFGLQVGSIATGNRLEVAQAGRRWLAYGSWLGLASFVPAVGVMVGLVQLAWTLILLATTVTSPTKQGLHDRFAGSAVVRPAAAGNGLALTCLVVALILPVIAFFSLVALVFMGGQVSEILSTVGTSVQP